MTTTSVEVVVIGAGPAGLSTALMLGRSRRTVAVLDDGRPRNARSQAVHGFLSRDGIAPRDLLAAARGDVARYPSVRLIRDEATQVERLGAGFRVTARGTGLYDARCVVVAIGVRDRLPAVPGLAEAYGHGVHHCPYCDAWEHADRPLAALGADAHGLALQLRRYSADVAWLSEGGEAPPARCAALVGRGVAVVASRLTRVETRAGGVVLTFADGARLERAALFLEPEREPWPAWIDALGCEVDEAGAIRCDRSYQTGIPGLYVVGDASRGAQFAIVAAGDGARAAVAIDARLQHLDLGEHG